MVARAPAAPRRLVVRRSRTPACRRACKLGSLRHPSLPAWLLLVALRDSLQGEGRATYWYAPAARAIVKSVNWSTCRGESTTELVAYRLRP